MKPTYSIELSDTEVNVVKKMSAGNPGAVRVLMEILKGGTLEIMLLLNADDMGLSGESIWLGVKDHCNQNIDEFKKCLENRDEAMVETINRNGGYAVCGGDSTRR